MSFVRTPAAFRSALAARVIPARQSIRMASSSTRHGNDPEVLEKGKQDVLRKHSKNSNEEPHWHEEIASDAEAFVKAQRDEIAATGDEIAKLQNKTKNVGQQKK